jgi:sugar phosphate permease
MKEYAKNPSLLLLAIAIVLMSIPLYGVGDTFALYVLTAFGGGQSAISISLIVFGIASLLSQFLILPLLLKCLKVTTVLRVSLSLSALSYIMQGFAPTFAIFAAMVPLNAIGSMANSCVASMIASAVSEKEQGAIQGCFGAFTTVGKSLGPLLLGSIFKLFSNNGPLWDYPQMVFFAATFFMCSSLGSVVAMVWPPKEGGVHS